MHKGIMADAGTKEGAARACCFIDAFLNARIVEMTEEIYDRITRTVEKVGMLPPDERTLDRFCREYPESGERREIELLGKGKRYGYADGGSRKADGADDADIVIMSWME